MAEQISTSALHPRAIRSTNRPSRYQTGTINTVNKRAFLKLSSLLMATPVLSSVLAWALGDKLKNWAGNVEYRTEQLYSADSLEQARNFVVKQQNLKVLGTRHCFNRIADSKNQFLSLKAMDKVVALDPEARKVTIESGMTYGQLCPYRSEEHTSELQSRFGISYA